MTNPTDPQPKKRSFAAKWGLPYAIVTAVLAWQFYGDLQKPNPDYAVLLIVCASIYVILYFVIKKQSQHLDHE